MMEDTYKKALQKSMVALPKGLNEQIDDVMSMLMVENCISEPTRQKIQKRNETPYENNTALIRWLITQPFTTYVTFKNALSEGKHHGALEALKKSERMLNLQCELKLYKDVPQTEGKLNFSGAFDTVFKKHDDKDVYACNKNGRKGLALIINNVNFKNETVLPKRIGSDVDCANISELLDKLGYKVTTRKDQTKQEMENQITNFKDSSEHLRADSTVVVILSHGQMEGIYGFDGELMDLAELKKSFNGVNCSALKEKPKLFFIQACRTEPMLQDNVSKLKEAVSEYVQKIEKKLKNLFPNYDKNRQDGENDIHKDADYFVAYSSTPGEVSWRNEEKGSWFIQALCQVIKQDAEKEDLAQMLVKVNNQIAYAFGDGDKKQISEQTHSLTKKFYFR